MAWVPLLIGLLLLALPASAERVYSNDRLASDLLGISIVDRGGKRVGTLRELLVDLERPAEMLAIVGFGGFFGLGEERRAYPLSWFSPALRDDAVLLDLEKDELAAVQQPRRHGLAPASELLGRPMNDRHGRAAGELRDLLVSLGSGKVRHAVVMLERLERQVTIAPSLLRRATTGESLVVDSDLADLHALAGR